MSAMVFRFEEYDPDKALLDLMNEILFVRVDAAQYRIESQIPLTSYEFHIQENYREFFKEFAIYANSRWKDIQAMNGTLSDSLLENQLTPSWDFSEFSRQEVRIPLLKESHIQKKRPP